MALIACYECGGKVSTSASACPHCGAPSKQKPTVTETNSLITDSALKAEKQGKHLGAINRKNPVIDEQVSQPKVKRQTQWLFGLILTAGLVVFLVVAFLIPQSKHGSPEMVSLINSEGDTSSCPAKNGETCMRDAERNGFVKRSEAVAGIKVDANTRPLRIIEISGTAAEAGVR